MGIALAAGIFAVLVAFAFGYGSRNQQTFRIVPQPRDDCSRACERLKTARGALCTARDAIRRLPDELASLTSQVGLAQLAAISLLAATVAAALIPFFGQFLASSLASAYLSAQLYVVFLLGQHAHTADALRRYNQSLPQRIEDDAAAMAEVRRTCSPEEAGACIGSLRVC